MTELLLRSVRFYDGGSEQELPVFRFTFEVGSLCVRAAFTVDVQSKDNGDLAGAEKTARSRVKNLASRMAVQADAPAYPAKC